jgi:hypothetical protein
MPTFHVRHIKTIIVIIVLITCEMARIGVKVHVRKISRFGLEELKRTNPFTNQDC